MDSSLRTVFVSNEPVKTLPPCEGLSPVGWKWLVVHLVTHARGDRKTQAISAPYKEQPRPEKAGVDSSILSLGTTNHFPI